MCPCQRVERACASYRSIGWEKALSATPYICLVPITKPNECQSNDVDCTLVHLPNKAFFGTIDNETAIIDHDLLNIDIVLDSINPSDLT